MQAAPPPKGADSAAACTRVMNSGRLPSEQFYIGYFNRGSGYRRAGDFDKALADFNKVVKLKPAFARGYHMRGLVQGDLGQRDDALADLDRAVELDTSEWSTYYARASLLRAKRRLRRGLRRLEDRGRAQARRDQSAALACAHHRRQGRLRGSAQRDQQGDLRTAATPPAPTTCAPRSPSRRSASMRLRGCRPGAARCAMRSPPLRRCKGRILEARGDTGGSEGPLPQGASSARRQHRGAQRAQDRGRAAQGAWASTPPTWRSISARPSRSAASGSCRRRAPSSTWTAASKSVLTGRDRPRRERGPTASPSRA